MILHLLKTDWQRLKRPLIVQWVLLLVSALPWLILRSEDSILPFSLGSLPENVAYPVQQTYLVFAAEAIATILALILASILGAQWAKQPVTPIRKRESLAALALSLLVFMILPLWLITFGNLLLHDFSPGVAAVAAGRAALAPWLLLGMAAAFAVWLPSPWLILAGWAALGTAAGSIMAFYPQLKYKYMASPTLPMLPAGPKEWWFGALAIALLVILFPVFRTRLNGPWKIVVAVALIVLAGTLAGRIPNPGISIAQSESVSTEVIKPSVRSVRLQTDPHEKPGRANIITLSAELGSIDCPVGHVVSWAVAPGGWISQDGNRTTTRHELVDNNPVNPVKGSSEAETAASAALPNGHLISRSSSRSVTYVNILGNFEIPPSSVLSPKRDADLHLNLVGTVFRFEKVWDVPLGDQKLEFRNGSLNWRVSRSSSENGDPCADVRVTHPGLGSPNDPGDIRWETSPIFQSWIYFYLPATGLIIPANQYNKDSAGPLFSAAGWNRSIIGPSDPFPTNSDFTGMRLILLKPVAVEKITATAVTGFRPWLGSDSSDYPALFGDPIDQAIYRREWFPTRPDPMTCSREEFDRWLRIGSRVYPGMSGSQYDLASYAPRFAGLMAKVGFQESVADGLRLGTPESLRDEVIGKINSLENPDRLADVAWSRGWLGEARESILSRFNGGGIWETNAVMALEEPSTYPELISRFVTRPEPETFERLRLLPGVEPQLGDEISKAASSITLEMRKENFTANKNSAPYGVYLYAAKRGDPTAFGIVLDLYIANADKGDYTPHRDLGYLLSKPEFESKSYRELSAWLQGKSAASFQFDPLLRLWNPLP